MLALACGGSPVGPLEAGDWGGTGIALALTSAGGTVEFDCGTGILQAAVALDPEGRFDVGGSVTPGHGGPEREGEVPLSYPARYFGTAADGRMTLTVRRDDGVVIGPFSLRAGATPLLRRCL